MAWESDHISKPQIRTEKARPACLTVLLQGLREKHLEYYSPVAQSCLTLCYPMDCRPPSSSVHGILQTRILEWVAISSSRGSSQPRDRTLVSHTSGRFFTVRATREAQRVSKGLSKIGHGRILGVMKTFCISSVTVVS